MKKILIAVLAYLGLLAASALIQIVIKVPNLLFFVVLVATFALAMYITRISIKSNKTKNLLK